MNKIKIIDDKYVYFGLYPQNGTIPEPIKWCIIKKEDSIITLMTDKILTNFMYDRYYSDYKDSAIRKYIHNEFISKTFSEEELSIILPTELECGVTDKVFLPSLDELKNLTKEERIKKVTPYAISNKASSYTAFSKKEKHLEGNGYYWTRTPWKPPYDPKRDREVLYVENNGSITGRVTVGHDIGIVFIIRIKMI